MSIGRFVGAALCVAVAGCAQTGGPEQDRLYAIEQPPVSNPQRPVQQINAIRRKAGREPIVRSSNLDAAARAHARDMAANGFFGRTGSGGTTVADRITTSGYRWCSVSENIAEGSRYNTARKVIAGWGASPGHYRNIVNPKARAFGMARAGDVWVQVFAGNRC